MSAAPYSILRGLTLVESTFNRPTATPFLMRTLILLGSLLWLFSERGQGTPLFGSPVRTTPDSVFSVGDAATVDYDADGDLDLVTFVHREGIYWIRNDGDSWAERVLLVPASFAGSSISRLLLNDADRDGNEDLFYPAGSSVFYYHSRGPSMGYDAPVQVFGGRRTVLGLLIFDVDGDGHSDVVVHSDDEFHWVRQQNGSFGNSAILRSGIDEIDDLAFGDFDQDGLLDIVFTDWTSSLTNDSPVSWIRNEGNGKFSALLDIAGSLRNNRYVEVADLDGDQWPDILTGRFNRDDILWWRNDQSGGFEDYQTITDQAREPHDMDVADLDGDGDLDVVVVSADDWEIAWIENLGGGAFGEHQIVSTNVIIPDRIEIADMNGDGAPDLLARGAVSGAGFPVTALVFENLNSPPRASEVLIAGGLRVRSTLSANYVYADGESDEEGETRVRWLRADDAEGTNKVEITGANSSTYIAGLADVDKWLSVEIIPIAVSGYFTGVAVESTPVGPVVLPEVQIAVERESVVLEDSGAASVVVTHNAPTDLPLTVAISIGGSAMQGDDYELAGVGASEVTIPVGSSTARITFDLVADNLVEVDEEIRVSLVAGEEYAIAANHETAILVIANDDYAPVANLDPVYSVVEDTARAFGVDEGVLTNDTDADDGDGPGPLSAELVESVSHGDLTFHPDGSFEYTPAPDYLGPDAFTYNSSDGTNLSQPIQVRIEVTALVDLSVSAGRDLPLVAAPGTVNHTVTVVNRGPSDANAITIDLAFVVPDGVAQGAIVPSTGSVSANVWTLDLAEDANATLQVPYVLSATAQGGIDAVSSTATVSGLDQAITNEDDDSATASSSIISPISMGILELEEAPALITQSGLFTQLITITNNNPLTIAGFRLQTGGLPDGVVFYNAHGVTPEGISYVDFNDDLDPGGSITLKIEFFLPSRALAFDPTYSMETVFRVRNPTVDSDAVDPSEIDRLVVLENNDFLIEFASMVGGVYAVEYTDDMKTWRRVNPLISAHSNKTQWIDAGPPKTSSHPSSVTKRYYRIVTLPQEEAAEVIDAR